MDSTDFEKLQPDDPNRCQGMSKMGQCVQKKVPGAMYCVMHGGNNQIQAAEKENIRRYRLDKWNARIQEFAESNFVKSLRDEIGILRMLMEERLNACQEPMDLILQSGPISDLVMKIENVVSSCHKLEKSFGQLLDKQAVLNFASNVIGIISELVPDEKVIAEISDRIFRSLAEEKE